MFLVFVRPTKCRDLRFATQRIQGEESFCSVLKFFIFSFLINYLLLQRLDNYNLFNLFSHSFLVANASVHSEIAVTYAFNRNMKTYAKALLLNVK